MNVTAERYRRFAKVESSGRSPLYEQLAHHVASSPEILTFLSGLPIERRQPNLLFGAVRLVAGTPSSGVEFEEAVIRHAEAIGTVMMTRTTQTNEPGRCASLLPSLASIEGPLALIEVGASAGLCLLPDFYGYDWGVKQLPAPDTVREFAPVFLCDASNNVPLPQRHPYVVWRAGLDLNPLDVSKDEDVQWLEHLVWPEHHERLQRLKDAISIARRNPPRIIAGDLRNSLHELIDEAPTDATIVVFHTAVLSYLPNQQDRDEFARRMTNSNLVWLSNESPKVFPDIAAKVGLVHEDMFLLSANGEPKAWCGPHGQSVSWI